MLCECKYRREPVGQDVVDTLVRRSKLVKNDLPRRLIVFSRSGFTDGAVSAAEDADVELLTLGDVSGRR